ncbi:hypothetical protein JHK87_023327 [Glycine soja]|nr:hypothetical protein JHK87_023327 [Glycine soja]
MEIGRAKQRTNTIPFKACTLLMDSAFGKGVHGHNWKHGFDSQVFVQTTTLVEFYSTLGDVGGSRGCLMVCLKEMFCLEDDDSGSCLGWGYGFCR